MPLRIHHTGGGQQYIVDGDGDDEGGGDGDDNDDDVDLEDQSYRLTFLPWYNCFGKVTWQKWRAGHFQMKVGLHSSHSRVGRFPGNYDVEKFLEIFSEEDYDAFCLAYMFTYR